MFLSPMSKQFSAGGSHATDTLQGRSKNSVHDTLELRGDPDSLQPWERREGQGVGLHEERDHHREQDERPPGLCPAAASGVAQSVRRHPIASQHTV